ncbi:alpha/beta fold hydrolase [Halobacillus litoralis]|uniref:alpha/beta fold hydrolase n=1 Tax=Halobacillus litoralis TaxID=45668 RepID=UPI001F502C73|nr:hypothetical protein [Halobacillus litoralis]
MKKEFNYVPWVVGLSIAINVIVVALLFVPKAGGDTDFDIKLLPLLNAVLNSFTFVYLTGEDDHMFKKDVTKDLTDMPKATLIVLSNSGHVVNLDQPDAFNKVSLTFMQTKGQVKAQDLEDNVYSIKS